MASANERIFWMFSISFSLSVRMMEFWMVKGMLVISSLKRKEVKSSWTALGTPRFRMVRKAWYRPL